MFKISNQTNQSAKSRLQQISNQVNPSTAMASPFANDVVPQAPVDPLFGLMAAYRADTDPKKVDLGIGAYRDNNAKPWILPVVKKVCFPKASVVPIYTYTRKKAEELIFKDPDVNHEYLPIAGLQDLTSASQKLILGGDSPAIKENRVSNLLLRSVSQT